MASLGLVLACAAAAAAPPPAEEPDYAAPRAALVREVERDVTRLRAELGTDRLDPIVVEALRRTPRHAFVPPALRDRAYGNFPLPIGHEQTISQPLIVALMSDMLDVGPGDKVYELGTGSGYQAAVLAEMGVQVYSVEIVPELAERAGRLLAELGYEDVHVRAGDGYLGWPEAAPFDAVIVTAAIDHVPGPLADQLRPGGRLVMPIGAIQGVQQLAVFVKGADGTLDRRDVLSVQFVPVTGAGARGHDGGR